jgi:type VI secretion system secreted protein VgrG
MEIVTPLGEDVLLFHGSAREGMSRPFGAQLDLLSMKNDIAVDDILGKNVTIKLGVAGGSDAMLAATSRLFAGQHV